MNEIEKRTQHLEKVVERRSAIALHKGGMALNPSQWKSRVTASGLHLFNRTTGLNVLFDEVTAPASLWARAPRQVSIALTNACDLKCAYCFAPKTPASLDFCKLTCWLDELDVNGCLGIGFGGGEPTLYRRLPELCHYAVQKTQLALTLTTHAHHLDHSLLAALAGGVNFMRISMDGVGATYEALRGRPFAALRRRFEDIRGIFPFGINYVVNARTFPDLDAAIALAAEVGATEFLLLPEVPLRGTRGIDSETSRALLCWVRAYRGAVRLAVSAASADGFPCCYPFPEETDLEAYAHIDASGVMKCTSFGQTGVRIATDGAMAALADLAALQRLPNATTTL